MAGVTHLNAGYSSTLAHSLLAEVLVSIEEQRNTVQPDNTIQKRIGKISKASVNTKYFVASHKPHSPYCLAISI